MILSKTFSSFTCESKKENYKYQGVKNFTRWLPHHLKSHLAWAFLPCGDILTSHQHFHLACMQDHFLRYSGVSPTPSEKSPCIFTSCRHSYLMWVFSPSVDILTLHGHSHLMWTFSPHVGIFTSHACKIALQGMLGCPLHHLKIHLTWVFSPYIGILTSCGHSPLTWAFSPHIDILSSHGHSHLL